MTEPEPILDERNVKVTRSQLIVDAKTFDLTQVRAVRCLSRRQNTASSILMVAFGLLLTLAGVIYPYQYGLGIATLVIAALGVFFGLSIADTGRLLWSHLHTLHVVELTTPGGTVPAVRRIDPDFAQRVTAAIQTAIEGNQ